MMFHTLASMLMHMSVNVVLQGLAQVGMQTQNTMWWWDSVPLLAQTQLQCLPVQVDCSVSSCALCIICSTPVESLYPA